VITKAERGELRSIVRQQFKVLRTEVDQRQRELIADVETQLTDRYAVEDHAWSDAAHLAHEAVLEANRKINDAFRDLTGERHVEQMYVQGRLPAKPSEARFNLRREAHARINATVQGAIYKLQRQEADLLRTLAVEALESDEARQFLSAIPTVGELVPATRLAEIEAAVSLPDPEDDL
jgi:hypothetical protein